VNVTDLLAWFRALGPAELFAIGAGVGLVLGHALAELDAR